MAQEVEYIIDNNEKRIRLEHDYHVEKARWIEEGVPMKKRIEATREYRKQRKEYIRLDKEAQKKFKRENKMILHPFLALFFDVVEELRALPNEKTPFNKEVKVERDVVYKTVDGQELLMDIYYPTFKVPGNAPAVIDIPGGAWMIHNRIRRDGYARMFATMGAVVFVIEHRLCPRVHFPENLKDCVDAFNYVVDNADKYGVDKDNITVTGDSSGGHMSACLGCAASVEEYSQKLGLAPLKAKPANLIFVSGSFSFDVMFRIPFTHTLMGRYFAGTKSRKDFKNWQYYKESCPYNYLTPDYPESYNNGGVTDIICAGEAKRMANKLTEAGVKNEYCVGKNLFNSFHCYVLRFPFKSARKDALKLYRWYYDKQKERGVDLTVGFDRIRIFFTDYKRAIKGKIKC